MSQALNSLNTLDTTRLNQIILDCTTADDLWTNQQSKGVLIQHPDDSTIAATQVDVHFMHVGVCKACARNARPLLISLLVDWPDTRIKDGPSYIEIGGVLGDQALALRLLALGEAAGLWKVITPRTMGFGRLGDKDADSLAGRGFVMHGGMT